MSATEWVFRHAGGCLIETPDLDVNGMRRSGAPWPWVATVWPDAASPDGWGVLEWERTQRGWWLPSTIALGDIIEFGIVWPDSDDPTAAARWYGWLQRCTRHALVLVGPFPHPAHAALSAQPAIDELRLAQLADLDDFRTGRTDGRTAVTATWQIAAACGAVGVATLLALAGWNDVAAIILIVGMGIGVVVTDAAERRIPTALIRIGALGAGLCMFGAWVRSTELEPVANALISAALVGLAFVVVYVWRPQSIGFGDVRLATLLSAITAWGANDANAAIIAVFAASAIGLIVMVASSRRSLPFAPCLIPASVAAVVILGLA